MYARDTIEFKQESKKHIDILMKELTTGITKRDVLPKGGQYMQGEAEAMYFQSLKNFFENSISHLVMER